MFCLFFDMVIDTCLGKKGLFNQPNKALARFKFCYIEFFLSQQERS